LLPAVAVANLSPAFDPKFLQPINDLDDDIRHALQRWQDVEALQTRPLAENYMRPGVTLMCDLALRVPFKDRGRGFAGNDEPIVNGEIFASLVYRSKAANVGELQMCNQKPVFISDVEIIQTGKDFSIPSLVGLYDIHDVSLDFFTGVLFQSIDGSYKTFTGFMDREFCVLAGSNNGLNPRVVKCGSKVVESVPQNQKQFVGERLSWNDCKNIISGITVCLEREFVRVNISEQLAPFAQVVDVLFGPFNL
jgi:hypothetical protein